MYNDDRSDFAAPIAVFLYIALISIVVTAYRMCMSSEIPEINMDFSYVLGVAGLVLAGFNLYKGYLCEGFSAALFALFILAFDNIYTYDNGLSIPFSAGLAILFAFSALVCYRVGVMDLAVIDACAAVLSMLSRSVDMHPAAEAFICIVACVPVLVALYVAFCDWTFAQEIIESYEDEFLGEEGCCDDDCCCEEHGEDCDCEECKPAEESAEPEVVETEDAAESEEKTE